MSNAIVVTATSASPAESPGRSAIVARKFVSARWGTATPLGRPVEPDVKITYARASRPDHVTGAAGASPPVQVEIESSTTGALALASTSAASTRASASTTIAATEASSSTCVMRAAG